MRQRYDYKCYVNGLQHPRREEGGDASSSAAAPGTGGLTNEERSRRNQEVAELASELNLAATHEEEGNEHGEETEVDDISRR